MSGGTRIPREEQRSGVDRFAEASSRFVSKGGFFTISLVVVVIWMPTIVLFSSVDTWQLVINTMTSVLAFLLIALLQNSERRYDEALHRKMDALVVGVADLLESEQAGDGRRADAQRLRRDLEELRAAVELEERV